MITIGHVESHFVTNRIIDKMRAFRLKRGELKYNLVRGSAQELKTMLDNEDIDVAYFMEKSAEKQSEYKYVILDRVQMKIVYAHNKYDFKEPIRFREFAKYPFLSVRKEASDMSKYIRETCNICGFEPIIIEAADIEERTQQLENGMGVALLPSNHREVYNKLLTSVIPSDLPCEHIVAIVAKNKAQGLLNDFIEAMKME